MRKTAAISLVISVLFSALFLLPKVFAVPLPRSFLPLGELNELMMIPQSINTFDPFDPSRPESENTNYYVNTAQITENGTIILMSEDLSSKGAVWSKEEYQLDLNKSFQIVMHLYFGDTDEQTDDGIAFVMQGFQSFVPYSYAGPSLGVLGENRYSGKRGVENSFAIEFDLQINNHGNEGNFFDRFVGYLQPSGHHLAFLWPGERSTYQDNAEGWPWSQNWYRAVQHYGTMGVENFTNGQWRRMEINWDPVTEILNYKFDHSGTVSVYDLKNKIGTDRVYWGFTGSTSNSSISPQIIFENIEGLVSSNASMTSFHTGSEIEIFTDEFIYPEEELRFEITINYLDGMFEWEDIVFDYFLLPEMQYKPESLYVLYSTGKVIKPPNDVWGDEVLSFPLLNMDENRSSVKIVFLADVVSNIEADVQLSHFYQVTGMHESIPLLEYRQIVGRESNPTIVLRSPDEMVLTGADPLYVIEGTWHDLNSSKLFIQFYMNGNLVESKPPVPPFINQENLGTWTFGGDKEYLKYGENILTIKIQNSIGIGNSVDVRLYLQSKPMISWGDFSPPSDIDFGEMLELPFNWMDRESSILQIYVKINHAEPVFWEQLENPDPGNSMPYTMKFTSKDLLMGENRIEIFLKNSYENPSNILSFNTTTHRALVFSSPPETMHETEPAKISEKTKTYKLVAPPIQILDTREKRDEWTLSVRLEMPFENERQKMISDFFYCDESGQEIKITDTDSIILSHITENAEDITLNQEGNTGFYVRVPPGSDIGAYQASLHWTLV